MASCLKALFELINKSSGLVIPLGVRFIESSRSYVGYREREESGLTIDEQPLPLTRFLSPTSHKNSCGFSNSVSSVYTIHSQTLKILHVSNFVQTSSFLTHPYPRANPSIHAYPHLHLKTKRASRVQQTIRPSSTHPSPASASPLKIQQSKNRTEHPQSSISLQALSPSQTFPLPLPQAAATHPPASAI